MKYTVSFNQKAITELSPTLDVYDAVILDYLIHFCASDNKKIKRLTIQEAGNSCKYTWMNFNYLIKELPILKIKGKATISRKLEKIQKAGYIKAWRAPDRSLYIRLTEKIDKLFFSSNEDKNASIEIGVPPAEQKCSPSGIGGVPPAEQHNTTINSISTSVDGIPKAGTDPRIRKLIWFYSSKCQDIKLFKPLIDGSDVKLLKLRLKEGHTVDEIEDEFIWFLESEYSRKLTPSLKTALSSAVYNTYLSKQAF